MGKKSMKIRDRREQEKQKKTEKYRKDTQERNAKQELSVNGVAAPKSGDANNVENLHVESDIKKTSATCKKSLAKAAGLKSTFIVDDEIIMTSFGKGNEAIIEKSIVGDNIHTINTDNPRFDVSPEDNKFLIQSRRIPVKAVADNPMHTSAENSERPIGQDAIHCKDTLEKQYFGRTFNDNIHIQLIYNILDINKILAIHSNNIVFCLNNLIRSENSEYTDFIGYMSTKNSYKVFCDPSLDPRLKSDQKALSDINKQRKSFGLFVKNPRLAYFGDTFYKLAKNNKEKDVRKSDMEIYAILALVGQLRQYCFHERDTLRGWIFGLDKSLSNEFKSVLDSFYDHKIEELNKNFLETGKVNLAIIYSALGKMYGEVDPAVVSREYYKFTVIKQHKNLGFSIKRLRESMLMSKQAEDLKRDKYNSVRSKLYKIIDFMIYYNYIVKEPEKAEATVEQLRSVTEVIQKDNIYINEAKRLWKLISDPVLETVVPMLDGAKIKALQKSDLISGMSIDSVKIKPDSDYFCKFVNFITQFLDGKEINDLLTTLINKFDNISSLIETIRHLNIDCNFVSEYALFDRSAKVTETLRIINSIARMQKPSGSAKRIMFAEALEVLGIPETKDAEAMAGEILGIDAATGRKRKDADNGIRNFIVNNVIESSRFKYLIRYNNTKKTRALAKNRNVVRFALSNLPESQIDRYFESCNGLGMPDKDGKIEFLADIITGISFSEFRNVVQRPRRGSDEEDDKMQKQAIIGLYLTVMYLITKNLVYINSRYTLAFHCLERDSQLHGSRAGKDGKNYTELTALFISNGWINKRASEYIGRNIRSIDDYFIRMYRNNAAHLSVIRNADKYINDVRTVSSYYELYHYIMQRLIESKYNYDSTIPGRLPPISEDVKVFEYFEKLRQYKSYSKDFVKALNTPFGYNLPRYKNLSINDLFDRNNPKPEKENK